MRDVKGATSEEVRMIKAIQRSVGALDNGWIGNQTLSDIAAKLGADIGPVMVLMEVLFVDGVSGFGGQFRIMLGVFLLAEDLR